MANVFIESMTGTNTTSDESGKFELEVPKGKAVLFLRTTPTDPGFDRVMVAPGKNDVLVRMRQASRGRLTAKVTTLMPR